MKNIYVFALLPLCLLFSAPANAADDIVVGVKVGMISSGTVNLSNSAIDWQLDTASSSTFGVFVDREVGKSLFAGLYYDNHTVKLNDGLFQSENSLTDMGVSLKVSMPMGDMIMKPGVRVGYGSINVSDLPGSQDSTHLLMHGFAEFYQDMNDFSLLGEIGFITSPSGGNNDFSLTWGPIMYFRGGVAF